MVGTDARALSLILSYSTGRVPIQCSIRVPADSTEEQIKNALNELDPSFNLEDCRIQLGRVEDNNVIEVFESSKRLNEINLSDLTVFVLPPEGCYLGKSAHEQYLRSAVIHKIEKDQVYKLNLKGPNGLPLTGKVLEIYTDFRFRVACSDSQVRQMMITEFADRDQYMLRPGDYVYVERWALPLPLSRSESKKFLPGIYMGTSAMLSDHYMVRIFPSEQEISVPLGKLYRRRPRVRRMYVIQRYMGIVRPAGAIDSRTTTTSSGSTRLLWPACRRPST